MEVLGEAGRENGRGIGAFKNSFEVGSGDWGFQCQYHPTLTFTYQVTRLYSSDQCEYPGLPASGFGSRMEVTTPLAK